MTNGLSFRKESILRSSSQSEAMRQSLAALSHGQGPRQARDSRYPAITTILTTIPAL